MLVTKFIDTIEPGQQRRLSLPLTMPRYPLIPLHGRDWERAGGTSIAARVLPSQIDRSVGDRPMNLAPVRLFRDLPPFQRSMDARVRPIGRPISGDPRSACQRLSSPPPIKNTFFAWPRPRYRQTDTDRQRSATIYYRGRLHFPPTFTGLTSRRTVQRLQWKFYESTSLIYIYI